MNHLRTYITSPTVSLSRFDHPKASLHRDPREETAPSHSINFIEKGGYSLQLGRRQWQMSRGDVFITQPGMIFSCRHREEFPEDVCFSVIYNPDFLDHQNEAPWLLLDQSGCVVPLNNRLAYLHMRLNRLTVSQADVMAAETLAGELLTAAAHSRVASAHKLQNGQQLAWYAERVEAARCLMETAYGDSHSLSSLARFTGMSPFHFARIFRELTGTPPHRFLMKVRLARACELLLDGVSVTEACFATGFANLSHFIRLFQRTFGVSPSKFSGKRDSGFLKQKSRFQSKH